MAAPKVRDLQALVKEQRAALQPQVDLINEQIQQEEQAGEAQVAGLEAAKRTAFGGIEQAASDKGMFFSGFAPSEQASYLGSTYLPALAELRSTITKARTSLRGKQADLEKGAFDTAFAAREDDRKVLADWNKMSEQQRFQASESQKQRVFEAQQNEANRQSQERISSADRASQERIAAAKSAVSSGAPTELVNSVFGLMENKKGSDSFVSPETYRQGLRQWTASGGSPNSFHETFGGYINPTHQEQFGGYY